MPDRNPTVTTFLVVSLVISSTFGIINLRFSREKKNRVNSNMCILPYTMYSTVPYRYPVNKKFIVIPSTVNAITIYRLSKGKCTPYMRSNTGQTIFFQRKNPKIFYYLALCLSPGEKRGMRYGTGKRFTLGIN
jgi:hypothetical protein